MYNLFKKNINFLFIIPIVLLICISMFFSDVYQIRQRELINEKMAEKRTDVKLITELVDRYVAADNDWGVYDYAADIIPLTEYLDKMTGVFAALYDSHYNLLSERFLSDSRNENGDLSFNPTQFSDFLIMAAYNNEGMVTLPYERSSGTVPIDIYFEWIPSDPSYDNRLLICVGILPESIETEPDAMLAVGMVAIVVVTFVLNMFFVAMIARSRKMNGSDNK